MYEGLTAVYGINTQATFSFPYDDHRQSFIDDAIRTGCFVQTQHSNEDFKHTCIVIGAIDNVELLATRYHESLVIPKWAPTRQQALTAE